jgi:hypothetical protein
VTDEEFARCGSKCSSSRKKSGSAESRQEDKQEIQKLKDQLGATQKTTDETQRKWKKHKEGRTNATDHSRRGYGQGAADSSRPSEGVLVT